MERAKQLLCVCVCVPFTFVFLPVLASVTKLLLCEDEVCAAVYSLYVSPHQPGAASMPSTSSSSACKEESRLHRALPKISELGIQLSPREMAATQFCLPLLPSMFTCSCLEILVELHGRHRKEVCKLVFK